MVDKKVLTLREVRLFDKAQQFLWTLRCNLHYVTDRAEERLVEGGAGLWGMMLNAKTVDKIHLFQAPKIYSGENLIHWTDNLKQHQLELHNTDLSFLEKDIYIEGNIRYQSR